MKSLRLTARRGGKCYYHPQISDKETEGWAQGKTLLTEAEAGFGEAPWVTDRGSFWDTVLHLHCQGMKNKE